MPGMSLAVCISLSWRLKSAAVPALDAMAVLLGVPVSLLCFVYLWRDDEVWKSDELSVWNCKCANMQMVGGAMVDWI